MFFNFIDELRAAGIKASFKEHLTLLEAAIKASVKEHLTLTGSNLHGVEVRWKVIAQADSARPSSARHTSASGSMSLVKTAQSRPGSMAP